MNKKTIHNTDIVIIGGGIAGCIAATSLAKKYTITLIDKLNAPVERIGESLAPASQRIFKELELFKESDLSKENVSQNSLGMQSYWGSNNLHIVDHLKNPDGFVKNLDRKSFEASLRKVTAKKGVHCLWGYKLYDSSFENNAWIITTKSNQAKDRKTHTIRAKFVIDASGRQAHFAKSIGIKRTVYDHLIACWFTIPNNSENKMSTIIADKLGWWYSAVTPNNKRIISFHTDADLVDKSTFKNMDAFLTLCIPQQITEKITSENRNQIDFKGTTSANSTKLNTVAGKRWIAIGDAAISFDPLSSQGMFNAMANAMQVKKLLNQFTFIEDENPDTMETFNAIYTQQINAVWEHYLRHKKLFYGAESRWSQEPFWARRR